MAIAIDRPISLNLIVQLSAGTTLGYPLLSIVATCRYFRSGSQTALDGLAENPPAQHIEAAEGHK